MKQTVTQHSGFFPNQKDDFISIVRDQSNHFGRHQSRAVFKHKTAFREGSHAPCQPPYLFRLCLRQPIGLSVPQDIQAAKPNITAVVPIKVHRAIGIDLRCLPFVQQVEAFLPGHRGIASFLPIFFPFSLFVCLRCLRVPASTFTFPASLSAVSPRLIPESVFKRKWLGWIAHAAPSLGNHPAARSFHLQEGRCSGPELHLRRLPASTPPSQCFRISSCSFVSHFIISLSFS